jgi:hypothetical protein
MHDDIPYSCPGNAHRGLRFSRKLAIPSSLPANDGGVELRCNSANSSFETGALRQPAQQPLGGSHCIRPASNSSSISDANAASPIGIVKFMHQADPQRRFGRRSARPTADSGAGCVPHRTQKEWNQRPRRKAQPHLRQ